ASHARDPVAWRRPIGPRPPRPWLLSPRRRALAARHVDSRGVPGRAHARGVSPRRPRGVARRRGISAGGASHVTDVLPTAPPSSTAAASTLRREHAHGLVVERAPMLLVARFAEPQRAVSWA